MKPVLDKKELDTIEAAFAKDMPDYTKITNGEELLEALGDESMKWAAAICQITKKRFDIDLSLMYIQGWIANVIEHSNEVRQMREKETKLKSDQEKLDDFLSATVLPD
jgi:hypothetical protein